MREIKSSLEKRRLRGVRVISALSALSMIYFGVINAGKEKTTFGFVINSEWVIMKEWAISAATGARIFSALSILASIVAVMAYRKRSPIIVPSSIATFGIFMAFITWSASGKYIPFTGLLQGALLLAVPLVFG